eukprot:2214578-Prymnesium_polylepis.1
MAFSPVWEQLALESVPLEKAVDPSLDAELTFATGGGFSRKYAAPQWQAAATTTYLDRSNTPEAATYLSSSHTPGRGYPDLAMVGSQLLVVVNGKLYVASGTSASAPIFAAILARVNLIRAADGKRTIGWLNPTLYHVSLCQT